MRHDRLTGKAAEARPDVADLAKTYVVEQDKAHYRGPTRRRVRREMARAK